MLKFFAVILKSVFYIGLCLLILLMVLPLLLALILDKDRSYDKITRILSGKSE
jgi:hypothetical protein